MKKTLLLNYLAAVTSRNPRKNTTRFNGLLALFVMVMGMGVSWGQVSMTITGSYTQNFNSLPSTGTTTWTNNSTIANWYASDFNSSFLVGTGSGTGGGLYSFGVAGTNVVTERALGSMGSGSATPAYGVVLRNTSGSTITDIKITYTGEQWRNGGVTATQPLAFYYATSPTSITSIASGPSGYTSVVALNFTSIVGTSTPAALDGNVSSNRTTISNISIPSLSLANNSYIILKWDDINDTGSDHGLAIDDLIISWTVPTSNSSASDIITQSGYSYSSNIDYATKQTASSLTSANSVGVNGLTLRDGGATTDADALGTTLTDITFSTGGSTAIRTAALFDGTNKIAEVAVNGATSILFTGLSLSATDGGTKDFELRVTYQSSVTDNQQIIYTVSSATASASTSSFAVANAGAAASSNNSDINRLEVTVSNLVFSQQPTDVNTNVSMSPAVTVTAKDANNNNDLDFSDNIRVSSTGTMTGSPVSVAAVNGVATFSSLTHTNTGTGLTLLAERNNSGSWDLDVTSNSFSVAVVSTATDYFRSLATGSWSSPSSWESSVDGTNNWITATLTPTSSANSITIRNGHTITLTTSETVDQVILEGIMIVNSDLGTLNLNNGNGDDFIINNGGILQITGTANYSATIIPATGAIFTINSGGLIKIGTGGSVGSSYNSFVVSSSNIWNNESIFEWNSTTTFGASGVTFFPNAGINSIPIFRINANPGTPGGGSATIINGILEVNAPLSWAGAGTKTIRNGLKGSSSLSQSTAGQIIFSGTNSEISGTATLNLGTNGLSVSGNLNVTGTLSCGTNTVSGAGTFTLSSGGKLVSGNSTGLNGSITVGGSKILSNAANYEFNGSAQQVTGSLMPSTINNLIINNSTGVSLSQSTTIAGTLTQTLGKLTIGTFTLTLNGGYSGSAANSLVGSSTSNLTTIGTTGTLYFDQTTPGTTNVLKNLTLSSGTATLGNALNITAGSSSGNVLVGTGATLTTGDFLTLKSDANGTASVGNSAGTITGNVTVERYIPAKRAWRALTAPVVGSTNNSVFYNWQNNGTSGIGTATGVEIWSNGSGLSGVTSGGTGSSLLTYNSSTNNWTGVTNTNTTSLFSGAINNPFMVFVTGPYASTSITSGSSDTTLKATGSLISGTQTYASNSGEYTFIGNPYASPLDLSLLLNDSENSGFNGYLWIWDAKAAGNNSLGGYNLFDTAANSSNGGYTNTTNTTGSAIDNTTKIQSGQAFFVKSASTANFKIKEAHKSNLNSNAVFRTGITSETLRVGLFKQENNQWIGRDGAMEVIFSEAEINQMPNKMANSTENIAFTKNGLLFASEHHLPLIASDVLNLKVWNTTAGANYKLKINTEAFTSTHLSATLEDLFTNSRTPLNLEGAAVEYPFTVTTDALSSGDRFRIVFQNAVLGTNNPTANGFQIVPNPVTGDSFQVNLGTLATGTYSYSICNAIGQEVEKGTLNNATQNTNYEVKMSTAATGIYVMKIKGSDNSVFTAKIIKK